MSLGVIFISLGVSSYEQPSREPFVKIDAPKQIMESSDSVIDASESFDIDGAELKFKWRQTYGRRVILIDANSPKLTVRTFNVAHNEKEVLEFEVEVSNQYFVNRQRVWTYVVDGDDNASPAIRINKKSVFVKDKSFESVTFDASRSSDQEDGKNIRFKWEANDDNPYYAQIDGIYSATPTIHPPVDIPYNEYTTLKFKVTVSDRDGNESTENVSIYYRPKLNEPPKVTSKNRHVKFLYTNGLDEVEEIFDYSDSYDPEGSPLTYSLVASDSRIKVIEDQSTQGIFLVTTPESYTGKYELKLRISDGEDDITGIFTRFVYEEKE